MSDEKTNIGVLVRVETWKEFQKHCIDIGKRPGELLDRVIEEYLEEYEEVEDEEEG